MQLMASVTHKRVLHSFAQMDGHEVARFVQPLVIFGGRKFYSLTSDH